MGCKCSKCGRVIQNKQALKLHEASCQVASEKVAEKVAETDHKIAENSDSVLSFSESPISNDDEKDDETLDIEDLFEPEIQTKKLACSECGCALNGDEKQCPKCKEMFE